MTPEIISPTPSVAVKARPHPFSLDTVQVEFPAGMSIREIVGERVVAVRVEIGGMTVPEEMWAHIRPKPGYAVVITRFPQGGNGKTILRIFAFAALAVGAIFTAGADTAFLTAIGDFLSIPTATVAGLAAATLGVVGSLVINALIPPAGPSASASASTDTLNSITGTGNQVSRYGPITCVVGTMMIYPTYAALPWTEVSGDDQYLRVLFDLGYGSPAPADMKIGDTDLASYTDVETEIGVNPSLFSQDILEESVAAEMDTDGSTATRTTGLATDEISIDWANPSGLFGLDSDGNTTLTTCDIRIEYSPASANVWTSVGAGTDGLTISTPAATPTTDGSQLIRVTNQARKAIRVGVRWKCVKGQYDVRLTRIVTNYGGASSDNQIGTMQWTVLRTIRYSSVSNTGTTKLAMRIKATDQLSGSISQFSCVISQPVPVWHADTAVWVTENSLNPAYIFRWMLRDSPANPRRIDPSRINDEQIKAWGAICADKGYTYSNSLSATTLYALLKEIAAAGRASFDIRNGQYSVILDLQQETPVQVFTPRNSSGFSGTRAFPDPVHALRVQFVNPEAGYQQDERIVYDDGYGDASMVAADPTLTLATDFEQLSIPGCVDADSSWKLGRYHLAASRLRPNTYSWTADVENLVCNRGDLVLVASDVIGIGLSWGKIKEVITNADGNAIALRVDEEVTATSGVAYGVRLRKQDSTVAMVGVTFTEFDVGIKTLTLFTPVPGLNEDDLFCFGELEKDTIPLVITKIEPAADLAATISAVDAAPAVLTADSGSVPAWSSQITGQPWLEPPPEPLILVVDSSQSLSLPDDAGNTDVSVIVTLNGLASGKTQVAA